MAVLTEPAPSWSTSRWLITIVVVVGFQFALVLTLTRRAPLPAAVQQRIQVSLPRHVSAELQALTDPTLFALGGAHGFSRAWMDVPTLTRLKPKWEPPPDWQELDARGLGDEFQAFARAQVEDIKRLNVRPTPQTGHQDTIATVSPLRAGSSLSVDETLRTRTLLNPPTLPSWPADDLLQPSKVRIVVDDRGQVISAVLLRPLSGSPAADQAALQLARQLHFRPLPASAASQRLDFGELTFNWHTTPKPASDAAPE